MKKPDNPQHGPGGFMAALRKVLLPKPTPVSEPGDAEPDVTEPPPSPPIAATPPRPAQSDLVSVQCLKCAKTYTLLSNATVVTWERTAANFRHRSGNMERGTTPDLISPIDRIPEHALPVQRQEVVLIRSTMRGRRWSCGVCNGIYSY